MSRYASSDVYFNIQFVFIIVYIYTYIPIENNGTPIRCDRFIPFQFIKNSKYTLVLH